MTETDIQAAIVRLQRCNDGESVDVVYAEFGAKAGQQLADYVKVADAYLAQLAANEQPVTREWLVELLGDTGRCDGVFVWAGTEPDTADDCGGCRGIPAILFYSGDDCELYLDGSQDDADFIDAITRADVLAFMRLVRWPTKGETQSNV